MKGRMHRTGLVITLLIAAVLLLNGCGEKIAIPVPDGLFGISEYRQRGNDFIPEATLMQLAVSQGRVFVLTESTLVKRNLSFTEDVSVLGLSEATALCVDEASNLVFVWENGLKQVNWYSGTDLTLQGSTSLPIIESVVAMTTNDAGVDAMPNAVTYLYLSDPTTGVIHRYGFNEFSGLTRMGILASSDGQGARFVHEVAGLVTGFDNRLLVCEADTNRNWVIRFDSTPDLTDTAIDPADEDPLRGRAFPFFVSDCLTAPTSDFVLGFAAECNQSDWVGGTSDEEGFFNRPTAVAVDGSGRIFVSDSGNNRVQIFNPSSLFVLEFGDLEDTPGVTSIGVHDHRFGNGSTDFDYGAFVYVLLPDENVIRKFISSEHSDRLNEDVRPDDN